MAQYEPLVGIVGVVGRAPEIKSTSKGDVTEFSVAVSDGFGDDANTVWYRASVWDEVLQESVQRAVQKGTHIAIQGTVRQRDGYGPDIKAFRVSPLSWLDRTKKGAQRPAPAPVAASDDDF